MTEFSFYQLLRTPLEQALPKILEKVRELELRAVVVVGSETRVETLSQVLWTYDPGAFLAHGSARDGHPGDQPIWLTALDENPNAAEVVVLADGATVAAPQSFQRCIEIFDGRDEAATAAARERYKQARDGGHGLKYFRQSETGWELGGGT
ncbi:MAG: DNA polymerase III subunit chi [Proteobacteria bacterium]|nr:DNA polymerase III subunit chi [Pseudomonadota bacterium]